MRKGLLVLAVLAIVATACAPKTSTPTSAAAGDCTPSTMNLHTPGQLTIATGNPAYKPWYGGTSTAGSDWKSGKYTGDPHTGDGYESAFAYALAQQLGFTNDQVTWEGIPFGKSFAPGPKDFDFAMQQISITPQRAKAVDFSDGYYNVNQALIADNGSPAIGVTTLAGLKDLKLGAPVGTTSLEVIQQEVQPNVEPGVYPDLDTALKDLHNGQLDGVVVDFPDAFYGYADQIVGQFPPLSGGQEQFGLAFEKGNPLVSCVNQAIATLKSNGTLKQLEDKWLQTDASVPVFSEPGARMGQPGPDPDVPLTSGGVPPMPSSGGDRWPKILGGGDSTARNVWIAVASTVIFFGLVAIIVVRSPGWPEIKDSFFNGAEFRSSFPVILQKFVRNIFIFCVAEVLVLILALIIAILRSLPGPVFTPLRIMAAAYTDVFRGVPTILVILLLGFGMPALDLQGIPDNDYVWAILALTLVYSAYVAEVYRAGIQSVHPSQVAAARSLGLSRWQSMRHVVLPQAVRRVVPPLLNDFIGLQKDSALVYVLGVVEALNKATIIQQGDFNFTPLVALSVIFIAITIPQARFVDWLIARDQRKRQSSAAV